MIPELFEETFGVFEQIIKKGEIPVPPQFSGQGMGNETLKYLGEADRKNVDMPDLKDWNVKLHMENPLLSLLNVAPEPPGIVREMVLQFGNPYKQTRKSLKFTIKGQTKKDFQVIKDANNFILVNKKSLPINPFWQQDALLDAMKTRLGKLIIVSGRVNQMDRTVVYTTATAYWDLNLSSISSGILNGIIFIFFKATASLEDRHQLSNPGIPFKIPVTDLSKIYDSYKVII